MQDPLYRIIDANINRIAEGLRVIEEWARFGLSHERVTHALAACRHRVCEQHPQITTTLMQLKSRHPTADVRAKEPATERASTQALILANFKRVQQACRVLEEYTASSFYASLRYDMYLLEKDMIMAMTMPLLGTGVYVISDDPHVLIEASKSGAVCVQLRDKTAEKSVVVEKASYVMRHKQSTVPLIINDELSVALRSQADGLHVGQDDEEACFYRPLMGENAIIGKTTHTLVQGKKAVEGGASYVSVGPLWETPTKPGRPGIGLTYLKEAHTLGVPFVAIGGICLDNLSQVQACQPPLIGCVRHYKAILNAIAV